MKPLKLLLLTLTALALIYATPSTIARLHPKPAKIILHTVEPGDTLWQIAEEHNPDIDPRRGVEWVTQENALPVDYTPQPGDRLRVPSRSEEGIVFEATAYTWTGERTASGTWPKVGTISVDPSVIPLGSRVYVEGYGEAVATDTGRAIRGRRIDVFMETEGDCKKWGVRRVRVKILN